MSSKAPALMVSPQMEGSLCLSDGQTDTQVSKVCVCGIGPDLSSFLFSLWLQDQA